MFGICAVIFIALAIGALYLRASLQAKAERERIAVERHAASEAIQTLKSLQSITTAGVNYQNYAPRVLDVKIRVDQYLASQSKQSQTAEAQTEIASAMTLYVFASQIWNATLVKNYREAIEITKQAEPLCPELVSELDRRAAEMEKRLRENAEERRQWEARNYPAGLSRSSGDDSEIINSMVEEFRPGKTWISPSFLWGCASRHISQAEKHTGR